MLYNIVLASATHRHESAAGIHLPPHLPPHPTPPGVTEHWAELPVGVTQQIPTRCLFTHGNVCVSTLFCQVVPPSLSPTVSTGLFSMSAGLMS